MESLPPFDQPHYDTVTSMTIINDYLVSGSKDKNLKLWSLNSPVKNLKCTSYAHNDYINTIRSFDHYPLFLSGARNGEVRIGKVDK
jgi:WD40 repeat protein